MKESTTCGITSQGWSKLVVSLSAEKTATQLNERCSGTGSEGCGQLRRVGVVQTSQEEKEEVVGAGSSAGAPHNWQGLLK